MVDWSRRQRTKPADSISSVAGNGHGELAAPRLEIRVGLGSCCVAGGSRDVLECLEQEIVARHVDAVIKPVGCVGICHLTPLVEVVPPGREPIVATRATPADVRRILRTLPDAAPWPWRWRNRLTDAWRSDEAVPDDAATACQICPISDVRVRRFVDPQVRIVTEHSGLMDPSSLEDYRARDGFVALERCVQERSPTVDHRDDRTKRASRPRRGWLPDGEPSGGRRTTRRARSTSSVTATKAIRVRSWIGW